MLTEIFSYMFPGMMVMWVLFIGQTTMSDIYTERDNKTLLRLMASPVTATHIVLSKFAHCFILCILVEITLVVITAFVFSVNWGNPFWLLFMVVTINFAMTGILALIYGISKKKAAADGLMVIVILGFGFVSGSFFPFEEMPKFFQQIGEYTVNRWAILGLRSVMDAKPLAEMMVPITKLFVFGFITMSAGIYFLNRRLSAGEGV